MAAMDEFREERERVKTQPLKKRLEYFWEYYKWHVLIIAFFLIFTVSMLCHILTSKDTVFMAAFIDCVPNEETVDRYTAELEELFGIDTEEEQLILDSSFQISTEADPTTTEILFVRIAAQELDVLLAPEDLFDRYIYNDVFIDIREVLSPEQLAYYGDSFYYVDYAKIIDQTEYEESLTDITYVDTTNHRSPEGMEQPIPVGIYVTGSEDFQEHYTFNSDGQEVVFGLAGYSECVDYALQFLDNMTGRVE
ncbi:MAG: hypothetical protein IJZ84_06320 [Lachnospiraceae bacterium]|nr:hypothetical protein [Lachnospiraceae bacterium]